MPEPVAVATHAIARAWRGAAWFVRGLTGEGRYEAYLAHASATHPGVAPMSRREFWRDYHRWQDANPQGRCC